MAKNPYHNFLKSFFLTLAWLVPFVILFNGFMDSYGIFHSLRLAGINAYKPQAEHHLRLVKALEVTSKKPVAVMMGSSRTRAGMRPEDHAQFIGMPSFNLGLSASTIEEFYAYLEHALYHQPALKEVIMELDLFMFNRHRKLNSEFDSKRLKQKGMILDDYLGTLFSAHALKNSFLTLKDNLVYGKNPAEGERDTVALSAKNKEFIANISRSSEWFGRFELDLKQVDYYAKCVQLCHKAGIRLIVYFSPAQAIYWETIHQKELGSLFENLKRSLCAIHPFYDFTGYNAITTRQQEKAGEWLYLDCSHFTEEVGRLILAKLYEHSSALESSFGLWMAPETVEEQLAILREEHGQWRHSHPEMVQAIAQLIPK